MSIGSCGAVDILTSPAHSNRGGVQYKCTIPCPEVPLHAVSCELSRQRAVTTTKLLPYSCFHLRAQALGACTYLRVPKRRFHICGTLYPVTCLCISKCVMEFHNTTSTHIKCKVLVNTKAYGLRAFKPGQPRYVKYQASGNTGNIVLQHGFCIGHGKVAQIVVG